MTDSTRQMIRDALLERDGGIAAYQELRQYLDDPFVSAVHGVQQTVGELITTVGELTAVSVRMGERMGDLELAVRDLSARRSTPIPVTTEGRLQDDPTQEVPRTPMHTLPSMPPGALYPQEVTQPLSPIQVPPIPTLPPTPIHPTTAPTPISDALARLIDALTRSFEQHPGRWMVVVVLVSSGSTAAATALADRLWPPEVEVPLIATTPAAPAPDPTQATPEAD